MKLSKKEYKYRCRTIAENHFNKEEQNAQAVAAQSHRSPPAAKK